MATISLKQTFSFHRDVIITEELQELIENNRAVDIIIKSLTMKNKYRIYLLNGQTGSGKSTYMIDMLLFNYMSDKNGKIFVSEPRIVLTKSNPIDMMRYNNKLKLGFNLGILNGIEKINTTAPRSVTFCTTQVLSNILLLALDNPKLLKTLKLLVIDEVHVLDIPMINLLINVKRFLMKYASHVDCPMIMFMSATMNERSIMRYLTGTIDFSNPYLCGYVSGSRRFNVNEIFMERDYNADASITTIIHDLFSKHVLNIDESKLPTIFVKSHNTNISCRDILIFVPGMFHIKAISKIISKLYESLSPTFVIKKDTSFEEIVEWRHNNLNKKRILIIGFAREFSQASDVLIETTVESMDLETLNNERRIIISTPVIETGKTISTIYLSADFGLQSANIIMPLSYNYGDRVLKILPICKNQSVQRLGRVGRESDGIFIHLFSKNTYDRLQKTEISETVSNYCLTNLLLQSFEFKFMGWMDLWKCNKFIFTISSDILLRSANDLIYSGMILPNGLIINDFNQEDNWLHVAKIITMRNNMLNDITDNVSDNASNNSVLNNKPNNKLKNILNTKSSNLLILVRIALHLQYSLPTLCVPQNYENKLPQIQKTLSNTQTKLLSKAMNYWWKLKYI